MTKEEWLAELDRRWEEEWNKPPDPIKQKQAQEEGVLIDKMLALTKKIIARLEAEADKGS